MTDGVPHGDTFFAQLGNPDIEASPPRMARRVLAAATRELIEALVEESAGSQNLRAAATAVESAMSDIDNLGDAPFPGGVGHHDFYDRSPLMGLSNPLAPPLQPRVEGDKVVAEVVFGVAYQGPPGCVHGGVIAAAFDDVLGMAQGLTGQPGMTGTLTTRYRNPTPLGQQVRFEGWVDRVDGRKIFAAGRLSHGETLCAEADGVWISVDFSRLMPGGVPPEG